MSVDAMKDWKRNLRNLHASYTLGCSVRKEGPCWFSPFFMYFTTLHRPTITFPVFPHAETRPDDLCVTVDRPQCGRSALCLCIMETESVCSIQAHIDEHGCDTSTNAPVPVSAADAKLHSTVDTRWKARVLAQSRQPRRSRATKRAWQAVQWVAYSPRDRARVWPQCW